MTEVEEEVSMEEVVSSILGSMSREFQKDALTKLKAVLENSLEVIQDPRNNQRRALLLAAKSMKTSVHIISSIIESREDEVDSVQKLMADIFSVHEERKNSRWTEEEVEKAIEYRVAGAPLEAIGAALGRSTQSVATKLSSEIGIARTEMKIRGMFEGVLEEKEIVGYLEGILKLEVK